MLTFPNITPAVFEAVLNALARNSTVTWLSNSTNQDASGLSGRELYRITGMGIVAEVSRDVSGTVQVDVKDKPWYITENTIAAKIREAIKAAQGTKRT